MPPIVQKSIPFVLWSTLLTGVIIFVVNALGDGYLESRDVIIKYEFIQNELKDLKDEHTKCANKMEVFYTEVADHHTILETMKLRASTCEKNVAECMREHKNHVVHKE